MNNFDQSSTGVNLELLCSYDLDRAQRDFEEAFYILQHSAYRQHFILVFNGFGDQDVSEFAFSDLENYDQKSITVKQLKEYCKNELALEWNEYGRLTKPELFDLIETELFGSSEYAEFLEEYLTPNFLKFESRGYCQGDYSEIIVPAKVYNSYINNEHSKINSIEDFEKVFSDSIFDNLLWDQPLYCRLGIEIEGKEEEFYFDEYIKDQYSYDESEILEIFEKHYDGEHKEYIKEWLADNLPTQPDCK